MPRIEVLKDFLAALGYDEQRARNEVKDGHFMLALIFQGQAKDKSILARLLVMAERGYWLAGVRLAPGEQRSWLSRETTLVVGDDAELKALVELCRKELDVALELVL